MGETDNSSKTPSVSTSSASSSSNRSDTSSSGARPTLSEIGANHARGSVTGVVYGGPSISDIVRSITKKD